MSGRSIVAQAALRGGAVTALLISAAPLAADQILLSNGGVLEGEVLERNEHTFRLRTVAGIVTVPAEAIAAIEAGPSVFDEYEERRAAMTDCPAAHVDQATWCERNGLVAERRVHLHRAIELDPDCESARRALGYVRVGNLWVDGRPTERGPTTRRAVDPDAEARQLATAVQATWYRRIRAIRTSLLDSGLANLVEEGRRKVLQIKDPLAILPLSQVLSEGSRAARSALVEVLQNFPEDEATMNLATLVLVERDAEVRERAVDELVRRHHPRVVSHLRRAVAGRDDVLVRRAAAALARLRTAEAIPELIDALTAERRKLVEVPITGYYRDWQLCYDGRAASVLPPRIGIAGDVIRVDTEFRVREVTVYRTEVLEALRQISGQDFGFEQAAWRRWHQENKS
jgi:hypothetical protein